MSSARGATRTCRQRRRRPLDVTMSSRRGATRTRISLRLIASPHEIANANTGTCESPSRRSGRPGRVHGPPTRLRRQESTSHCEMAEGPRSHQVHRAGGDPDAAFHWGQQGTLASHPVGRPSISQSISHEAQPRPSPSRVKSPCTFEPSGPVFTPSRSIAKRPSPSTRGRPGRPSPTAEAPLRPSAAYRPLQPPVI